MTLESHSPESCVHTRSSIWRMFRDAADEDYLVARSAVKLGLIHQFCWSSQQCLEKYIKAILLLNSKPIVASHSLISMWDSCCEICGDLLPSILYPIREFQWERARHVRRVFEKSEDYLARVEDYGNANIRYRVYSIHVPLYDLNKLDQLCFALRRVAFPLDMQIPELDGTARDYLTHHRSIQIHPTMGFDKQAKHGENAGRNEIFRWRNFAYFYDEALAANEIQTGGGGSINAEPFMCLQRGEDGFRTLEWLAQNAFPKGVAKSIFQEILARRHGKQEER